MAVKYTTQLNEDIYNIYVFFIYTNSQIYIETSTHINCRGLLAALCTPDLCQKNPQAILPNSCCSCHGRSAKAKHCRGLGHFLLIRQLSPALPVARRLSSESYVCCEDAFDTEWKLSRLIIPLLPYVLSRRQNSKQPKGKSGPVSPLSLRGELNQELINA